jgi:hypothetical protein
MEPPERRALVHPCANLERTATVSTTEDRAGEADGTAGVGIFGQEIEVVNIPVSDVDRAGEFYTSAPGEHCAAALAVHRGDRRLEKS